MSLPSMMYSSQDFYDMPSISRKRGREEDDETANGTMSFGEHRNKRIHCLPLRTAITTHKRWSGPPGFPPTSVPDTITPVDSDSEDAQQPKSHFSPFDTPSPTAHEASNYGIPAPDVDFDMAMDTASPPAHEDLSRVLEPGPHHGEHGAPAIAGRMPTPIQPSFAAQVRGGNSGWSGPGPTLSHFGDTESRSHPQHGFVAYTVGDRTIPRTMEGSVADWHLQNRRLPSPISEGADSDGSLVGTDSMSPGMVLDAGFSSQLVARLESHVSDSPPPDVDRDTGMADTTEEEDIATTTLDALPHLVEVNSAPATPSPGRKGHMRSRHTVNSWAWQPGMKKTFSIGYRADCEKCRLKVPGHFNHIIIS